MPQQLTLMPTPMISPLLSMWWSLG